MLIREIGITRIPTSMSATASDLRKKLVAFWSFFSSDTARMTRMFPPIVSAMMTSMSSAGQFFSLITALLTDSWVVKLSRPKLMPEATPPPLLLPSPIPHGRVWLRSKGLLLGQAIRLPTSKEDVVVPNPPRRALAGPPISKRDYWRLDNLLQKHTEEEAALKIKGHFSEGYHLRVDQMGWEESRIGRNLGDCEWQGSWGRGIGKKQLQGLLVLLLCFNKSC